MTTPFKRYHHATLDSTNDEAKRLAKTGVPSCVIVADKQTHGRGQHDRIWASDTGGLYLSFLLSPTEFSKDLVQHYHTQIGTIIQGCILNITTIETQLEWPNDIILNHKKCGGILLETLWPSGQTLPSHVIIGIGLNLNQTDFPAPIHSTAISLYQYSATKYDKMAFIDQLIKEIPDVFTGN